ncbi:MAG: gliding motility-associated C-terminal domain-containing protein [Saprospiraceae bacterium]|nr:gliding motility-associated C-terminal domain-containing protein [Saprospiraceae bacterium]
MIELKVRIVVVTIVLFYVNLIRSQNLIRDGSFEDFFPFKYEYPFSAFEYLKSWEVASFQFFDSTLITSPDLFIESEKIAPSIPPSFWNISSGASQGKNHIGLRNTATQDGAFLPEAISTELISTLEEGAYYSINLDYRNKGHDLWQKNSILCLKEHLKKLDFFFDNKKVNILLNEIENLSYSSIEPQVEIRSPSMKTYQLSDWEKNGTCFQAKGHERFMTISMTTGRIEVNPPCVILDDFFDDFLHYYFDIDNIVLEKIPEVYYVETVLCDNKPSIISLKDSLYLPVMTNEILFEINGQVTNDKFYVSKEGDFYGEVKLDCTNVPLHLRVHELNCEPIFFIPNIFTPDFNGLNDFWKLSVRSDVQIISFKLVLFDRWGNKVFLTEEIDFKWDGKFKGQGLNQDLFTYLLQYEYIHPVDGLSNKKLKGELLLLR